MKKLAFSVWPDIPNNKPLPEYLRKKTEAKLDLLNSGGFEFFHLSSCSQDDYAKKLVEKYTLKPTARKATSVSDYIRVAEMVNLLENGVDEIFYMDYDFHLWELPTDYGITLESHIQADENGRPVKLWYRGQNSTYYLSRAHLGLLKRHLSLLQRYLESVDFKPKYCFPMNYLGEIEETVGYIPGFRDIGSVVKTGNLWDNTVNRLLYLSVYLKDMPSAELSGVNMVGSVNTESEHFIAEVERLETLRDKISREKVPSEEEVRDTIRLLTLRPNYNSLAKRRQLKEFVKS